MGNPTVASVKASKSVKASEALASAPTDASVSTDAPIAVTASVPTDAPTVPTDASVPTDAPTVPTDASVPTYAPDLQTALASVPALIVKDSTDAPIGDAPDSFGAIVGQFSALIAGQTRKMVEWYIARGDLARSAINAKIARSTDKPTRASNRASAVKALTMAAEISYDSSAEPAPNVPRWVGFSALVELFPDAAGVASVKVLDALVAVIARSDKPGAWDAPETYYVRPRFNVDEVNALIGNVIADGLNHDETLAALEIIGGRVMSDPAKDDVKNPVDAAIKSAESVWEKIANVGESDCIDGFAFFERFATLSAQYGYAIHTSRDGMGAPCHRLMKIGK